LDGRASSDPDGDPLTFKWSLSARPSGSSAVLPDSTDPNRTFVPDKPGVYVVQLIVDDGNLQSSPETVTITAAAAVTLGCGDLISGNITAPGQVDQITFNGQVNDKVTLTLAASGFPTGATATATVFSPTGAVVSPGAFNANSQQQLTLPETGTYVI